MYVHYSQSQAIIGLGSLGNGGAASTIDKFVAVTVTDTTPGLLQDKMQAGDSYISYTVSNPSGNAIYKTLLNIANLVAGLTGKFIRNQSSSSSTSEDSPGNILLSNTGSLSVALNDPAPLKQQFYFDKGVLQFADSTLTPAQSSSLSASAVGFGGADSISFGYSNTFWQPSISGTWYPFKANPLKTEGYSFPRLKWLLSATDTIQAELPNKIVDSNGNPFSLVNNVTYGKQIQIPGTSGINPTNTTVKTFDRALCVSALAIPSSNYSCFLTSFVPDSTTPINVGMYMRTVQTQNASGQIVACIYDSSLSLIATCSPITNPANGQVLFTISSVNASTLISGNVYYFGLLHNMNSPQYGGISASANMNGAPGSGYPPMAWKIDNIGTITPPASLSGGSETLLRIYGRIG